jgi:hypothetical protein
MTKTLYKHFSFKRPDSNVLVFNPYFSKVRSLTLHCTQLAWMQHAFNLLLKRSGVTVNCIYKHMHSLQSFWIFNSFKSILARIYSVLRKINIHSSFFHCCIVHSEIHIVHSPTNALIIKTWKGLKFTLEFTQISLLHVSVSF